MSDPCLAPPVPADCDLRGLEWMPLYGGRLFGSDFDAHASDAEWRAAIQLWWAAWNQVPASSLPDDDVALCRLAGFGRDLKGWAKVRQRALHGFFKCSDGRLYHRQLSEFATESWRRRVADRDKKKRWRERREKRDGDGDGTVPETGTETGTERSRDGSGTVDEMRCDETGQDETLNKGATPLQAQERSGDDKPFKLTNEWRPSDAGESHAVGKGLNVEATVEEFLEYFVDGRGKSQKRTSAGWERRWRIWCNRNAGEHANTPQRIRSQRRTSELAAFARGAARVGGDEPF